jgi:2-isopropylmalate synthase
VPDTVGYSTPEEYGALVAGVRANVPGIENATISAHCHDDLGLAVANSLAAASAGARQVECTINGIGERAGNAALEEFVMALHTRGQFFGLYTNIETRELGRTSRLVSKCTGVDVPPNKAVVGANAFAHEAGIHQDGVLKNRLTYEIMSAETVGWSGIGLVLGKHSGRHALRAKTEALGYELNDEELSTLFARFKELADRKKLLDEGDIHALLLPHLEVAGIQRQAET